MRGPLFLRNSEKNKIDGEPYGHTVKFGCDEWQVTFLLSRWKSVQSTGILEEDTHAEVNAPLTFSITPVGMALGKTAQTLRWSDDISGILGSGIAGAPAGAPIYEVIGDESIPFARFEDGWRINMATSK
jgi:hypothetical protein